MKTTPLLCSFALSMVIALTVPRAQGKAVLLDFGPTVTQPAYATNSPAHWVGAVPATEINWNTITADTNTLYYSDGSAASGVSLDLGRSTAGSDTVSFSDNGFSVNALGTVVNGGVYAGSSPVRDGIFGGSGGANNLALGLRVNGLPSGTYTLYVHGRNSNTGLVAPLRFYATNGPSADTYAFTTNDAVAALANTSPAITNGFVEGNNFGVLTVTLSAGQSLYIASEGTAAAEMRGFMNAIAIYFGVPQLPARITSQPASRSVYEGVTANLSAGVSGAPIPAIQWYFNGTNVLVNGTEIAGANSNTLTLRKVTAARAGSYNLAITNTTGSDVSSNAVLSVVAPFNTAQVSNMWNLAPGDRAWLGTGGNERSIAYNPVTKNLLVVSRAPVDPAVMVLDAMTGAEKHSMDMTGIPPTAAGSSVGLSTIAVADDGVVFGASVTIGATSPALYIYGWPDDSTTYQPSIVFAGDPAASVQPNLRYGDNFAVRGAGPTTQILMAPSTGTNVVLFRSTSGHDFQNEIPPAVIAVSGVPSGFARWSIAFGPGTNTFWAKTTGGSLYLIEFDVTTAKGSVLKSYSSPSIASGLRGIGVDPSQKLLAGVLDEAFGNNVQVYDAADLVLGPVLRDQEVFETQYPSTQGSAWVTFGTNVMFALDENNGIKAFGINAGYVPPAISITTQPTDRTAMEGATVTFSSLVVGLDPLTMRWRYNGTNELVDGPDISGAHTELLTLRNITLASAGAYSLFVSNMYGNATSSNASLTVAPTFNTPQMTNIWSINAEERSYLGTNFNERGIAFNTATTNLLLVSRSSPDPTVVVLDGATGAEKYVLNTTGIPATVPGVSLGISTIGVADDGAVYAASVTTGASSTNPFSLYRWANDAAGTTPAVVFAGDPALNVQPGLRWTDAMAVRGSGPGTQVLLAPGSGTNVVVLRTSSGNDFQNEIPPGVIAVSNVPSGFARLGIAFGPSTNTFWAKSPGSSLYLVQFDLASSSGTVLYEYSTNVVAFSLRGISTDPAQRFLAGVSLDLSHNVQIYDIANLAVGPVLRDQEVFATANVNNVSGGTAATAFGGKYLFALDTNNGLKAFVIDPDYVAPITEFSISSVSLSGDSIVLRWQSVAGKSYQVQGRDSFATGAWADVGGPIVATGETTAFTNSISGSAKFYRVRTP